MSGRGAGEHQRVGVTSALGTSLPRAGHPLKMLPLAVFLSLGLISASWLLKLGYSPAN